MNIYDATKIKSNKKYALLLGTGNSVNQISKDQYEKIKERCDIWGINNFFLHKFIIPDFLHFEIKADINGEIFPRILKEKKDLYKNTVFISDIVTRERDLPYKFLDLNMFKKFYSYRRVDRLNKDGSYIENGNYKPEKNIVQITHGKSNSKIMDLMVRMDYEKIFFCGIDLNDCNYFWTDNNDYSKLNIPDSMSWCGKLRTLKGVPVPYEKEEKHPSYCLSNFFSDILNFNNIKGYNLSKTSELRKKIETISVDDMIAITEGN